MNWSSTNYGWGRLVVSPIGDVGREWDNDMQGTAFPHQVPHLSPAQIITNFSFPPRPNMPINSSEYHIFRVHEKKGSSQILFYPFTALIE